MKKEIIIFLVILGMFFVAGCAENGTSEEPVPSTPAEEADNGGAESEVINVEIRDYKYTPQNLTVEVGQTVRWTNYDTVLHDVVGSGIESEYLQKGESFTYTFEEEGNYQYICTLHPWMEGEVIANA